MSASVFHADAPLQLMNTRGSQTWRYSASLWLVRTDERRWRAAEDDWDEQWGGVASDWREREGARDCCVWGGVRALWDHALRQLLGSSSREDQSVLYTCSKQRLTQKRSEGVKRFIPLNPEQNLPSRERHQEEEADWIRGVEFKERNWQWKAWWGTEWRDDALGQNWRLKPRLRTSLCVFKSCVLICIHAVWETFRWFGGQENTGFFCEQDFLLLP